VGAVGGESCQLKNRGPSGVRVDLLTPSGDFISHVFTSDTGDYSFPNVIPGQPFYFFNQKTDARSWRPLCHVYICTICS
jgi:hypothetical protein